MTFPKKTLHLLVAILGFALGLVASGCLDTAANCSNNLKACGTTCADVSTDKSNCGACGNACALGQVCQSGACVCEPGTEACGGACVVLESSPENCGACGNACPSGQVCETGACKTACTLANSTVCDGACVDLQGDTNNCGACGKVCDTAQTCQAGTCSYQPGVVAACFNGGGLVAVQGDLVGAFKPVGTHPSLLAAAAPVLLEADTDGLVRQVRMNDLAVVGSGNTLASDPEGLLAAPPYLYAVDDTNNALTVFGGLDPTAQAQAADGGYTVAPVGGYSFGTNSGARAPALLGQVLYVPQYGNLYNGGSGTPIPGHTLARVDVGDPANPKDAGTVDLSALDLHSFDGGTAYPQPAAAAVFNGKVYVALSNLDAFYSPAGPGLLAKFDPADGGLSEVNLGADACLAPYALTSVGDKLVVSCAGQTTYNPPDYLTSSTVKSGLVLLDGNDQRIAFWAAGCNGKPGCQDPSLGRIAARDPRVWAADQTAGRLFVLDVSDAGFTEVRTYANDAGPLQVCVGADGGSAGQLVGDVAVLPVPALQ